MDCCEENSEGEKLASENKKPMDKENVEGKEGMGKIIKLKLSNPPYVLGILIMLVFGVVLLNQYQIVTVNNRLMEIESQLNGDIASDNVGIKDADISDVNISDFESTKHSIRGLFPVDQISSQQDADEIMVPTGTPEYSEDLGGISFDEPEESLHHLAEVYPEWNQEAQQDTELWNRYLNLMSKPVGISCEYCCGLGATMVDPETGQILCGCQHAPALASVTLGLMENTDYSDEEILRESLRWKALFFPQDMVSNAVEVSNKDLENIELPGMVGPC